MRQVWRAWIPHVSARATAVLLPQVSLCRRSLKLLAGEKAYKYAGARTLDAFKEFSAGGYESAESEPRGNAKGKDEL